MWNYGHLLSDRQGQGQDLTQGVTVGLLFALFLLLLLLLETGPNSIALAGPEFRNLPLPPLYWG